MKEVSLRKPVSRIVSELGIPSKYSGSFALIPANLDLDRHLERYPVTDYFFAKDESGHIRTVNHNGSFGYCFDKERLIHIIGLISSIPAGNRDLVTDDGYVPINSSVIRNYFKDYLSYLDYLLRTGALITDEIAVPEEKSYGYKFSPEYANQPMTRYVYLSARDVQQEPVLEERFNRHTRKFEHNPLSDFPYLSHWYEQKKLEINPEAEEFAWHRRAIAYKSHSGKDPQAQYQSALYNIIALKNKEYKAQIDSNVHRLHSAITNMQKDYRNFLKYDIQELTAIDISNSQPFLLTILFNPDFWDKNSDVYINIGHLPDNIQMMFSSGLISEIRRYVASIPETKFQDYIREASAGNLYEFMQREINNPEIDRSRVKTMILITFFSDNRYISQQTEDADRDKDGRLHPQAAGKDAADEGRGPAHGKPDRHQVKGGSLDENEKNGGGEPPDGLQHRYSFLIKRRGRGGRAFLLSYSFQGARSSVFVWKGAFSPQVW